MYNCTELRVIWLLFGCKDRGQRTEDSIIVWTWGLYTDVYCIALRCVALRAGGGRGGGGVTRLGAGAGAGAEEPFICNNYIYI